jgi:hypothetical protein
MNSGIYQLTFTSGHYYIGKSENIPKRWDTHKRNFDQHKHTKRMQWAYDNYGMPQFQVVLVVHPDHLDLYERAMIQASWVDHLILNGTKPQPISQSDLDKLDLAERTTVEDKRIMQLGTLEHIDYLWLFKQQCDDYKAELEELQDKDLVVKRLQQLEQANENLYSQQQALQQEINYFKNLNWWQRIWY